MASNTPGDLPGRNTASPSGAVSQEMRKYTEAQPAAYDFWKRVQRSHALTEAGEASRQGIDESRAHEMLSNNMAAEQALRMSQNGEAFKRRRTEHESDNYTSTQNTLQGDLMKPLSNTKVMQAAPDYNPYVNAPITSGSDIPGLHSNSFHSPTELTSYHGGPYYDTPSPFLSRHHKGQYYETPSPFLSASIRATAPGFVPQTPTRRSRASFGDLSITESPGVSGGVSLGNNDAVASHHQEVGNLQLPGLGAAQGSMIPFGDVHHYGSNEGMSITSANHIGFYANEHEISNPIIPWDAGKIPGLVNQSRPLVHQNSLPSNPGAQQKVSLTVTEDYGSKEPTSLGQDLCMSSDTPKTNKNGSTESKSRPSEKSSDPSTVCVCESSSTDSAPPVWEEKHHGRAFKMQNVARENLSEAFRGAFDILGTMNPDHYQMPRGSRVVCIKCTVIDDILMSIQTGLWACNANVMARIVSLWEAKTNESEKVLLLWSVPGSKNFCGLAELQDYRPDATTDFFQSDAPQKGAMVVHWLYCKLVPFDDVRKMDGLQGNDTVTQMWSGMHYSEEIGRKVVEAYVRAPHFGNLLAKPPGGHFRQPPRRNNNNAGAPTRGGRDHRGGHRPQHQQHHRPNGSDVHNRAPHIGYAKSAASSERSDTRQVGQAEQVLEKQAPSDNAQAVGEPKLQMMPVFVHPDGTITAAVSVQGSFSSLEQMQSIRSLQSSIPVAGSTPLTAQSTFSISPSSRFRTSEKMVGFQQLPADRGRPEPKANTSHEMVPPGQFYKAGGPGPMGAPRSSPSVNRFAHGYNNSDGSGSHQGSSQPQTPARRPYHSTQDLAAHTGSPLQGTPTTPRAWGGTRGQQGQTPMYQQFHTPVKSPFATKVQTPVHHEESVTPLPSDAGVLGHRARNAEAFSSHELRTNSWIEELVGSPGKRQ